MDVGKEIQSLNLIMSRINGMSQRWAQGHGMNVYEAKVLYALDSDKGLTQKQISNSCAMPKQTVNNVVRSLQREGLVVLETNGDDKREKLILLTDKGGAYLRQALEPLAELGARMIRRMGHKKYCLLLECLQEYSEAMEKEMEEIL